MKTVSENRAFDGVQGVYAHPSVTCGCEMTFALYLPPEAAHSKVPLLWYLSGLTCTHENAMTKAGMQKYAAELGMAVCFPDTSPRGSDVADDTGFDMGQGAGFYVDATQAPWDPHFRMWSYVTGELPRLIEDHFPVEMDRQAITGHSMGGHGALTVAMRHPGRFASVSAFAPIANPMVSDWGRKQFTAYLGEDEASWKAYDSSLLMREHGFDGPVLIDQGTDDQFLDLLHPETLAEAMAARRQDGVFRFQKGYDHSYFFMSSFMEAHMAFHADALDL
ncbi:MULTISPECIES: S-formylglutathione hydrolase [unclassified Meridianimarinicoccus]|uniref:S-formylglutathione hydrolase n=1 Tax=unclassified Meridianimarinicoccus TaxID=2923344 RepID=UPI001867AEFF|nr:S-formylglutathione hydrolase [Fluviibacterium sp. MJW13]